MSTPDKKLRSRISVLTAQLIADHPFFGIFLSSTDIIEEDRFPTAATDGTRIYYSAEFFNRLEDAEIKALLLHECLHIIYNHCDRKRRGIRGKKKWNRAIDYSINWEIEEMNHEVVRMPKNFIINGKTYNFLYSPKYKNLYAEQIYDMLPEQLGNDEDFDIHIDAELDEDKRREIEDRILSSYEAVKSDGGLSSGVQRIVNEIRQARVPWARVLHRYIGSALNKSDYSYSSFNRRFIGQDLYLPGLRGHKLSSIAVVIDTSASVGEQEIGAMANELRKIAGLVENVIVISCDTDINSFEIITSMSNFTKAINNISGYGATDFRAPFVELAKRKIKPELLIYMTDGAGTFPQKSEVPYPVIWAMTNSAIAPFGISIEMRV